MSFDFRFKEADSIRDIIELFNFIKQYPLDYPDYEGWLRRAEREINSKYKKAILAFNNSQVIGSVIYQPHKDFSETLEIKNLRVHEEMRRRGVGSFLLKQVEAEARQSSNYNDMIIIDFRESQRDMLSFLKSSGFEESMRLYLYDNRKDVVMIKMISSEFPET